MNATNFAIPTFLLASILTLGCASLQAAEAPVAENMDATKSDQPVTDTWITTKVKSELATTDGVTSMDITVKTVDGVVTLTGTQATHAAVKKAVIAAETVKGVKNVDSSGLKSKQ
jgi:hyperosmotically inducible protein